jgi:hypothetical protein
LSVVWQQKTEGRETYLVTGGGIRRKFASLIEVGDGQQVANTAAPGVGSGGPVLYGRVFGRGNQGLGVERASGRGETSAGGCEEMQTVRIAGSINGWRGGGGQGNLDGLHGASREHGYEERGEEEEEEEGMVVVGEEREKMMSIREVDGEGGDLTLVTQKAIYSNRPIESKIREGRMG